MKRVLRSHTYVTRMWKPFGILFLVACMAWATPATAYDWKIESISVKPTLFPAEGTVVTIECSWSRAGNPSDETSGSVMIIDSYKGMRAIIKEQKLSPSSSGGNIKGLWAAQDMGDHTVSCEVGFTGKDPLYSSKEPDYTNNKKSLVVKVSANVQQTKWPTAPIIATPGQNQKVLSPVKILVKPYNPYDKNCKDNGVLSLSKQTKGSKMLSKPIPTKNCTAEGAIWELDLVPGVYEIKAQLINYNYKYKSDESAPVTFEVIK